MIVAHNLASINAQRQLNTVERKRKKAVERLSSGFRVNSAADDAAGLAISEKMRSQIRGLARGAENIQNGISYCQVADGAMNEVHAMLHRINELAVQAANGTNTQEDREDLDHEVQLLKEEIDGIFEQTTFNTRRIWDSKMVPVTTTVVDETIHDTFPSVVFGTISSNVNTNNSNKLAMPSAAINVSANEDGILVKWKGYNGVEYESRRIAWDATQEGAHSFKLSDHMDYSVYPEAAGIDFTYSYHVNEYATKEQVIQAFNTTTSNVSNYSSNLVTTKVTYASDSEPKVASVSASISYEAMLASGKNFQAYDTAFVEPVSNNNPALAGVDDNSELSFTFTMPGIGTVKTKPSSIYYAGNHNSDIEDRTGEDIWWKETTLSNGNKYKSTKTYSIPATMTGVLSAINNTAGHSLWSDNDSGGYVYMSFSLNSETPYMTANGSKKSSVGTLTVNIPVNKSKAMTQSELEDYVRRALANVSSVDISDDDGADPGYFRIYRSSEAKSSILAVKSTKVSHEVHTYAEDNTCDVYIQSGANSGQGIHMTYSNLNTGVLGIRDIDVWTQESASDTIGKIKNALEIVSKQRSVIGAYQNRLEHAERINRNVEENTMRAESGIRDADMAEEILEQSKQNILSQVGISMITQLNQSNRDVLSLLQ